MKVRLHGIDTPESGQDFGSRAKQAASDLAFGQTVTVHPREVDRYGRTVAEVMLPDVRSLNREMVRQGMAWWYKTYAPRDAALASLEAQAKATRRGMWGQPDPVPPWSWRRGDATQTDVFGNRRTWVFHRPHCSSVARMKEGNRVAFRAAGEAERAGYRRAGDCDALAGHP